MRPSKTLSGDGREAGKDGGGLRSTGNSFGVPDIWFQSAAERANSAMVHTVSMGAVIAARKDPTMSRPRTNCKKFGRRICFAV
jgi:hypothetical protein